MSALTAARVAREWAPNTVQRSYAQAASTQIWEGGLIIANASGYATPAVSGTISASGTGYSVLGVAQFSQLTTTGVYTPITVHVGYFNFVADSAFAKTAIGATCYIVDDKTVSLTSTNRSAAGVVADVDADGNPYVKVGL